MVGFLKTTGTLLLLLIALPINSAIVFCTLFFTWITHFFHQQPNNEQRKRILLTGGKMTKALQLARSFHRAGHEVFLVETHKYWLSGHRFSRTIKAFYTVPAPEKYPDQYCQELLKIVKDQNIDVFIPVSSPVASYHDAVAGKLLSSACEVLHFSPEITQMLDNKFLLCQKAQALGLSVPKSFSITDPQQILDFDFASDGSQYILKSIHYNSVSRLDLTRLPFAGMVDYVRGLPISPQNPWIMQEYIVGQEYCTHSTVRQGKIRLHCCSRSSPFQVNYEHVNQPEIFAWIEKFVEKLHLTGQISFDFIQAVDGTVYPIECNPRTHSAITMFYNHPGLVDAYLNDSQEWQSPIIPLPDSKPTYWLYHELWRLTQIRSWSNLKVWLQNIMHGKDALFQLDDPLPFLTVPHWQITLLLLDNLRQLKNWIRIDFNIGKLVEFGGD